MRLFVAGLLLGLAGPLRAQDSVIVIDPNARPSDSFIRGGPPADVVADLIASKASSPSMAEPSG
jgi:hypothetical protein